MNDESCYYLAFSLCLGIGPMRFRALLDTFHTAEKAFHARETNIASIVGRSAAHSFYIFKNTFDFQKEVGELIKKEIQFISQINTLFPQSLRELSDCPIGIYTKGNAQLLTDKAEVCAIVGTRKPTEYGRYVAHYFSDELTRNGIVIVSGLALGVDGIAHSACLSARGRTIAVLGCGVDICYPPSHQYLYDEIIAKKGTIISEFPPSHMVKKGLFIARNRLIAGLSRGVLVVEGTKDSGSLTTARFAASQGKDVFAPPSPITSSQSEAPNLLLQQGAKCVTKPQDILEEWGLRSLSHSQGKIQTLSLTEEEKHIIGQIESGINTVDRLVEDTTSKVEKVSSLLSILEIKGLIYTNVNGKIELKYATSEPKGDN